MNSSHLAARLTQLRGFLESAHPGWRIGSGLFGGPGGTPAELFRPPAIRILPPEFPGDGILRWPLEYWPARTPAPAGKLTGEAGMMEAAERLRRAILSAPAPAAYRLSRGAVHRPIPGAVHWTEAIEEPFAEPSARRVALLTALHEVAFSGGTLFGAGSTVLEPLTWAGDAPSAGKLLVARDGAGVVYLGMVASSEPLTLASPLPRSLGPAATISVANRGLAAPGPASEALRHDRLSAEALPAMLDGSRRRLLLRAPLSRLTATLPLLSRGEAAAWEAFLEEERSRAVLLWGSEDGRLYEAGVLGWSSSREPGSSAVRLVLECDAAPADNLDHHHEVPGP